MVSSVRSRCGRIAIRQREIAAEGGRASHGGRGREENEERGGEEGEESGSQERQREGAPEGERASQGGR